MHSTNLKTISPTQNNSRTNRFELPKLLIQRVIDDALAEDFGRMGDITTQAVVPEHTATTVVISAREDGCIAGLDIAKQVFETLDDTLDIELLIQEGTNISKGTNLMRVKGSAKAILMAERVALNFVGRLSGIASKTAKMVKATGEYNAKVCSTRKTTPNLRMFEKYAVRVGGGMNHRLGLDDAVLIKDNHIAMSGGITTVLKRARENVGHMVKIEIEVDDLKQLQEVLDSGLADVVMLDNMSNDDLRTAVKIINGRLITEASGNVNINTIADIAATGVDIISVGALTHSAKCLDIGLDFIE